MSVLQIMLLLYLTAAIFLGLSITLKSSRFKQLSFWKQILLLSISPILAIREFFFIGGRDDKNS
jgi:hypothetical protein